MTGRKYANRRYVNVALPTELVAAVRNVVTDHDSYYTSMADFVKEALREKLERLLTLRKRDAIK